MGAFILAWLTGEAIICYRSVKMQGGPPWPGQLLAGAGAFAVLAVLAEAGPDARKVALTIGWGLNAAGFLALFPVSGTTVAPPTWANTVTGTDPRNSGWWDSVTANLVSDTSVLPGAGGCGGSSSGAASSGGSSSPGASIKSGEQSGTQQVYPGGCPAGQMRMPDGSCVKVVGM